MTTGSGIDRTGGVTGRVWGGLLWRLAGLLALVALVVAGCGSDGGSEASPSSTAAAAGGTSTSFGVEVDVEAVVEPECVEREASQRLTVRTGGGAALSYSTTFVGEGASTLPVAGLGSGSAFADDQGEFSAEWTVPADVEAGPYEVAVQVVTGEGRGRATASFAVADDEGTCS